MSDSWDPIHWSPAASSVRGIIQARILEWAAITSSRGSSQHGDWTCISYVSCTGRWVLSAPQDHLGSFLSGSHGKESAFNAGETSMITGIGKIPWRREGLPTPVFLSGEFCGQRSWVNCSQWGSKSWTQLSDYLPSGVEIFILTLLLNLEMNTVSQK